MSFFLKIFSSITICVFLILVSQLLINLVSFSLVYNMMVRYFLIVCKMKHETTLLINYKNYFSSYCLYCHFSM